MTIQMSGNIIHRFGPVTNNRKPVNIWIHKARKVQQHTTVHKTFNYFLFKNVFFFLLFFNSMQQQKDTKFVSYNYHPNARITTLFKQTLETVWMINSHRDFFFSKFVWSLCYGVAYYIQKRINDFCICTSSTVFLGIIHMIFFYKVQQVVKSELLGVYGMKKKNRI